MILVVYILKKIFILYQNTNYHTYDVSGGIYGIDATGLFGIENNMYWFKMPNANTNLDDYYILDAVSDLSGGFSPAILRDIQTNNVEIIINENYYSNYTGASNNFAIFVPIPIMMSIEDGGDDMFDDGNYISFSIDGTETANIVYGSIVEESTYGYYVGNGVPYPHLAVGYATSGTLRWRTSGNRGADGGGSIENRNGTYTCSGGRHGSYWLNIVYDAGDPSIGDLWFTIEKDEWGTNITSTTDNRSASGTDSYDHNMIVAGDNFLFCKALLSRDSGEDIDTSEVETFLENYVEDMDIMADLDDFGTIDLSGFSSWYATNSTSYVTAFTNWYSYSYDGGEIADKTDGLLHLYFEENATFSDAQSLTNVFKNSLSFNGNTFGYTKTLNSQLVAVLVTPENTTEITLGGDNSYLDCVFYRLHRRFLYRFSTTSDDFSHLFAVNINSQTLIADISGDTSDDFDIARSGRYAMTKMYGDDGTTFNHLFTGCEFIEISGSFQHISPIPDFGENSLYAYDENSDFVIALTPDGYRQTIALNTSIVGGVTRIPWPGGFFIFKTDGTNYELHNIDISRNYVNISDSDASVSLDNVLNSRTNLVIYINKSGGVIIYTYNTTTAAFSEAIVDNYTFDNKNLEMTYPYQSYD